jgi:DNA ligase (NAD+)
MKQKTEIQALEEKIDKSNDLYNNFGESDVSDAEYDSWLTLLEKLDPTNKRFTNKKVGAASTVDKWDKFDHGDYKMGSQNKVNNLEGLEKWASKFPMDTTWMVEHKLDGTSIKLIYENGKLVCGSTRGDGLSGESITVNVKKMNGVPHTIKDTRKIIFRGEILLYKSKLALVGGKNTRNTAAGTAKRFDGEGCQHLNVQVYNIMNWKELGFTTVEETIKFIKAQGFTLVETDGPFDTIQEVHDFKEDYENNTRTGIDWDIDGLIVQPNKMEVDEWDYPKRSMAYKFKAAEGVTKLLSVEWNDTGGRIAPRGLLEPVDVGGVTISAATLNNIDHIKRIGVKIGDLVVVSRRNDVIPAIECVSIPSPSGKVIEAPTHDKDGFPIVHEKNALGEELVYLVSTNPNSRAKVVRSIISWYKAHETKGVAEETINAILDAQIATDLPSFYKFGLEGSDDIINIANFGAGKFKVLKKATLQTSKTSLLKFMNGMDLQGFSDSRFLVILEHFNKPMELDDFLDMCMDVPVISSLPGFGMNTATSLASEVKEAKPLMSKMRHLVEVEKWSPEKKTSTKINGLSFCFTGTMAVDRSILEKAVKKHGGLVAGVSKKLDYLVANPGWSSGKTDKAEKLGVKMITEEEFMKMIGGVL